MKTITVNGKTYYSEPQREPISTKITQSAIGQWVLCRTRNAGLIFGLVEEADETGVVLTEARRFWRVATEKGLPAWYEGVAKHGLASWCKVSEPVSKRIIIEDYELTLVEKEAVEKIKNHPSAETTYDGDDYVDGDGDGFGGGYVDGDS